VARHAKPHLHDGTLTLVLDGKSYSGGWRYSAPPQGKGTIDLFSADGRAIHCTFKSSTAAANAIGWCDDESGNLYDLHIDKLNSGH
jgi:hypothetical protein